MDGLDTTVAVLGKPYMLTKSRLGAITKVFGDQYLCDVASVKELFQTIGEKLSGMVLEAAPRFSFLISYTDNTHQDGATHELLNASTIATGKKTERVVMRWEVSHMIEGAINELSITVRISNPINPLIVLQAALSKSPSEIDNFEFEMGSTCVTVDGASQLYADEVFLRVHKWIEARNKPHAYISLGETYHKHEWLVDRFNTSFLPLLLTAAMALYASKVWDIAGQLVAAPIIFATFMVLRDFGGRVNVFMERWARISRKVSLFLLTNGDSDALTKLAARAKNSLLKLTATAIGSLALNIGAGVICWYFLPVAP